MRKLFIVFLLGCVAIVQAQFRAPYFNMLTVDNGLPEASISSSVEDRYGFLWMGTGNGLVRYDGYQLKPYTIRNEAGVPVNPALINYIFEDSRGTLWVFVNLQGLYYLDRKRDAFAKLPLGKEGEENFKRIRPNSLKEDRKNGLIWMEVLDLERDKDGICVFDLSRHTLELYHEKAPAARYIPSYNRAGMAIDAAGNTWVVADSLLCKVDPVTRTAKPFFVLPDPSGKHLFISVLPDPSDPDILWLNTAKPTPNQLEQKINRNIFRFNTKTKSYSFSAPGSGQAGGLPTICFHAFTDSLNRVWLSTDKGIALYDRKTGGLTPYPMSWADTVAHAERITADKEGNLWVAGTSGGLYFLDLKSSVAHWITANDGPGQLPVNKIVSALFFDRSGTFWAIINGEGIAWRDRYKTQFAPEPLKVPSVKKEPDLAGRQFSILGTLGDSLCIIGDSLSMYAWNTLKNTFDPIDLRERQLYKSVIGLSAGKDGVLWMACGLEGLIRYDPANRSVRKFQHAADSLVPFFMISVATDKNGTVWVGSSDKGLCSFDPVSNRFTYYPYVINSGTRKVKDSLDDRTVQCLYFDRDGILWLGTNNGSVNSYNTRTGKFRSYMNYQEGLFAITSIFEDSRRRLWVTTYLSGLYLLDRETGSLKRFTEKEGLIHNSVYSVCEDRAGNLWVATTKGMARINPSTNAITNFASARPLQYQFFVNQFLDRNGILHVQARNGMLNFDPLQLDESNTQVRVLIESVGYRLPGRSADTLLFTEAPGKIRLKYNQNRVSFNYVGIHFADPSRNQYAYMLEGYDKDWVMAGTQRSVTYTNLSPGTYTFRVKATNSDGVWNENGATITVVITPPWWKTWWAYCLYALAIGGGIWAFVRYRSKALLREKEVLEQKVEHRTRQLRESIDNLKSTQAQLVQSEKMASLGELTAGIAHEIQNPLNFVNNFAEVNMELIDEAKEALGKNDLSEAGSLLNNLKENEEKIRFHGTRADGIVKAMLQHSRAGSGQKEPTDLNALCDEYLRLAYHGLRAKDKSFTASFKAELDPAVGLVTVQAQDIGRVILNLINNAFYAVSERKKKEGGGYEPTVRVTTRKVEDKIEIRIIDNGTGIPQKVIDKIFQPFFTTKPTGEGTGLGLSLSYDIVTKGHGGELRVETKEGEGTTFTIKL